MGSMKVSEFSQSAYEALRANVPVLLDTLDNALTASAVKLNQGMLSYRLTDSKITKQHYFQEGGTVYAAVDDFIPAGLGDTGTFLLPDERKLPAPVIKAHGTELPIIAIGNYNDNYWIFAETPNGTIIELSLPEEGMPATLGMFLNGEEYMPSHLGKDIAMVEVNPARTLIYRGDCISCAEPKEENTRYPSVRDVLLKLTNLTGSHNAFGIIERAELPDDQETGSAKFRYNPKKPKTIVQKQMKSDVRVFNSGIRNSSNADIFEIEKLLLEAEALLTGKKKTELEVRFEEPKRIDVPR